MSPINSATRRSTVSAAALLGMLALLFSGAAPASAAPGPANIDDSRSGSITIHKFAEPDTPGTRSDGQRLDPSVTQDLSPLQGVSFTVTELPVALETSAGWREAEALKDMPVNEVKRKYQEDLNPLSPIVTDGSGTAARSGLEVGLYLVEETGSGSNQVVQPADPFLVSIPTAGPQDEWIYDIHAYPKNSVVSIDMTVDENETFGLNNGPIDWTITTSVPRLPADDTFQSYELRVALDERLDLPDGALRQATIRIGDFQGSLEEVGARIDGRMLIISSSDPGVLQLLSQRQGERVAITIPSTIVSNDLAGGSIENTATVSVNNSARFPATARTDWGAVKVIARTADASGGLQGGLYEVRRSTDGAPLEINGVSSFESNADGAVIIPGLRAGHGYYLAEVRAPRGYTPMSTTVAFEVEAAGTSDVQSAQSREDHPNVVIVEKEQVSGFALPITGSFGSLPFILAGLLLVATALIVNRQRRRRLARAV